MKPLKTSAQETCVDRTTAFMNRLGVQWLLKLLLSLFLLGLLLRSIELSVFWKTIRSVDFTLLLVAVALFFPAQLLAAYRWHFLLKRLNRFIPFWLLVRHTLQGQLSGVFLPGRIGADIVRAIAVTHGRAEKTILILSVIIDKMALLIAMISFALLGIIGSEPISRFFLVYWVALGLLVLALLIMFFLCRYRSRHALEHLVQLSNSFPLASRHTPSLLEWPNLPRLSAYTMLAVFALAFALQLSYAVGSYITARSMHITINPIDWAAISALVALAQILPLTIGGLGVREGLFAGILILYQVPVTQSMAFSLLGFILVTILLILSWFAIETALIVRTQKKPYG